MSKTGKKTIDETSDNEGSPQPSTSSGTKRPCAGPAPAPVTPHSHIKRKTWQWMKTVRGFGLLKEGLAPFCVDITKQQHEDILDDIKRKNNVTSVSCGQCNLNTLQPDHKNVGNRQCQLRQANCNCCYTKNKSACPNNVCGTIYDKIISYHASTPPAPNWKNTDSKQWITDPWSIAKCFINAPGYEKKISAADIDCTGLLHVIINNKYFHNHVSMTAMFLKVRQYRNQIFHSSNMKLDKQTTDSYIDDMIAVLKDGKELINRQDAKEAVKKLEDLKNEDLLITTEHVEKVLGDVREEVRMFKEMTEELATKEEFESFKQNFATIEFELKQEINNLKDVSAKMNTEYDTSKADLQKKLIKEYRDYLLHMPAMPCQPDHECSFEDVYVTPRINLKSKNKDSKDIETEVKTMSDIFIKDGEPLKSIYILGEAGSGKSSFCKSLIQCWCLAHSVTQNIAAKKVEDITEYHADLVKVMKTFNFLFFLPLRYCTDKISITAMLEENYEHHVLKELLERESETCLIVLDGLDEWTHTSKRPPMRASFSKYTVLTTSRPWKIVLLRIKEDEMRQRIYINGVDYSSMMNMIKNTLQILHEKFPDNERGKDKDGPQKCESVLKKKPFYSMTDTAMMFQQLICLWFDDKLHATSKCHLYTCMIDLFFVWYKHKDQTLLEHKQILSHDIELPECFNITDECKSHSYIVQGVSRLAYETLFKNKKELSLSFDSSMFKQLNISNNIKDFCLELGILSEEKGPSLSASSSKKSHISFIHKSVQEFLAAVYVVLNINTEQEASLDMENADLSDYLQNMFNIKTVDELLEQENVLIMLCGLETRLAKSISNLIYDIVSRDERVVKYRKKIGTKYSDDRLIKNIQDLALSCIEENKASNALHKFSFNLRDLIIDTDSSNRIFHNINEPKITLDRVISIKIDRDMNFGKNVDRILDCMTKCKNLELIDIEGTFDKKVDQCISDIIESNALTLKSLSLENTYLSLYGTVLRPPFRHIANITHLVALNVAYYRVTHEDFTSICAFLSDTCNLQQISIKIYCECWCKHEVDLSKHKQLQYLDCNDYISVTNVESTNLEFIKYATRDETDCKKVLDCLIKSINLKEIHLQVFVRNTFAILNIFASDIERSDYYEAVTNMVITFLPTLQHLRELGLQGFMFTDNIITCPSDLKTIEKIDISHGTMSLTTWRKFVDSVAELPQPIKVKAFFIRITRDGEECKADITRSGRRVKGGEEAAALQYVREREALFYVSDEEIDNYSVSISFSTKK